MEEVKAYLGLLNINKAKYGAAIQALRQIMCIKPTQNVRAHSYERLKEILVEEKNFLKFKSTKEYVNLMLRQCFYELPDMKQFDKLYDDLDSNSNRYSNYIVSMEELLLLKKIYKKFIIKALKIVEFSCVNKRIENEFSDDYIVKFGIPITEFREVYKECDVNEMKNRFIQTICAFLEQQQFNPMQLIILINNQEVTLEFHWM